MIVFELICAEEHRFEGWFGSAEAFEQQRDAGLLVCPVCSSAAVGKLPSARIRRGSQPATEGKPSSASEPQKPVAQGSTMTLASFIDQVLKHTEDVGARFPEEARKIHHEEAPRRGIRGTASREEAEALADEGIAVFPLPIPPPEDWH
ncbi:MAG TPA: DUF1178 family protein [Burkholderiales bacterium]|nr:DUF1178 family protein [Burkholderiales bacterium]